MAYDMTVTLILDVLSWALLMAGAFLVLVGALGLVRMPDFYTRMHPAGITDTLGTGLILLGLMLQAGFGFVAIKLFLIGAFLFFTSPTSTHAIANAALVTGLKPEGTDVPPHPGAGRKPEESGQ